MRTSDRKRYRQSTHIDGEYRRLIRDCQKLSRTEEARLLPLAKSGNAVARETVVRSILPYVVGMAQKYARRTGAPLMDLIQAGNQGLLEAIDRFDLAGHAERRLITYATQYIKNRIWLEADKRFVVTIPQRALHEHGTDNVTERCRQYAELAKQPAHEADATIVARDEPPPYDADEIEQLHAAIAKLPERRSDVIRRHLAGENLHQQGERVGLAYQRIQQIYQAGLRDLREILGVNQERKAA